MSEKISNNIISTIEIIMDKKLSEMQYSRIVVGTILYPIDEGNGIYNIEYQGSQIQAYRIEKLDNVKYKAGDVVDILISENTIGRNKIILGHTIRQPEKVEIEEWETNRAEIENSFAKDTQIYRVKTSTTERQYAEIIINESGVHNSKIDEAEYINYFESYNTNFSNAISSISNGEYDYLVIEVEISTVVTTSEQFDYGVEIITTNSAGAEGVTLRSSQNELIPSGQSKYYLAVPVAGINKINYYDDRSFNLLKEIKFFVDTTELNQKIFFQNLKFYAAKKREPAAEVAAFTILKTEEQIEILQRQVNSLSEEVENLKLLLAEKEV